MQNHKGNLLSVTEGIIVHGCNCLGAMGAGVAKAVRSTYPDVYEAYRSHFEAVGLKLGDTIAVGSTANGNLPNVNRHLAACSPQLPSKLVVVNAMTQEDFGGRAGVRYVDYDALSAAFARIRMLARDTGLPVHFPLIGCGLANGLWSEVEPRIVRALGEDVECHLWEL